MNGFLILEAMAGLYFLVGTGVLWLLFFVLKVKEKGCARLAMLPFLPLMVIWVAIFAILSVPFYWLYPERHMNIIDFEGADQEKQILRDYRKACRQRGFFRRIVEKMGLRPNSAPPWPFPGSKVK